MSIDLRYPNITATNEAGQLVQMKSFLYQTIEQLNWAFKSIETGGTGVYTAGETGNASKGTEKSDHAENFNEIKALIIRSADIVNAYYEKICARLEGVYVAQSEFGEYTEQTASEIEANSTQIQQLYESLQTIGQTVDGLHDQVISANAYIKTGLLYYADSGAPVYGLEIGQTNSIDGEETFDKFARFTSDRLSFYDRNDTEVAYISDYKLFITNAEVTGTLTVGRYRMDTTDGIAFVWVGGEG